MHFQTTGSPVEHGPGRCTEISHCGPDIHRTGPSTGPNARAIHPMSDGNPVRSGWELFGTLIRWAALSARTVSTGPATVAARPVAAAAAATTGAMSAGAAAGMPIARAVAASAALTAAGYAFNQGRLPRATDIIPYPVLERGGSRCAAALLPYSAF